MERITNLESKVRSKLRIWKEDEDGNITIADSINKDGKLIMKKFTLKGIASFIWKKCDGKMTIKEIVSEIVEKYKVDEEEATNDTIEFLSQMLEVKQIIIF